MKLKTARWQETYSTFESEWHTPTIKIAAEREYDESPVALIFDEDTIVFDDVNKREIALREIMQTDIEDSIANVTIENVGPPGETIYYCEIAIIKKWRKKRK